MSNPITKQLVKKVLKKLEATDATDKGDEHDEYEFWHDGKLITSTGMRRSSNRDIPLPHVKKDLGVNEFFLKGLAACPISREQWLRKLGIIPEEDDEDEGEE